MYREYKRWIHSCQQYQSSLESYHHGPNIQKNTTGTFDQDPGGEVLRCWRLIEKQCNDFVKPQLRKTAIVPSGSWKTIRVFVSSTFADCHSEREVLVKQVFPTLREWCEAHHLHLVECDLRWGVPRESTTHDTICTCMAELDCCHEETDGQPFFINITGHRYGWIPCEEEMTDDIREKYDWVQGMSITAMEILHGAYRSKNPNAAFFLRDSGFLKELSDTHRKRFQDDSEYALEHLKVLKEKLAFRFPEQVFKYNCKYDGVDSSTGREKVRLSALEGFGEQVLNFLKTRIEQMYPDQQDVTQLQEDEQETETHHTFLEHKSEFVLGRNKELKVLVDFASGTIDETLKRAEQFPDDEYEKWKEFFHMGEDAVPIVCVSAPPGLGKSALVARVAQQAQEDGIEVLYHSVQCSPVGGRPERLVRRIIQKLIGSQFDEELEKSNAVAYSQIIDKFQEILKEKKGCHNKLLIVLDGLNEMTTHDAMHHLAWLPPAFPGNVRCIVSANNEHKFTMERIMQRNPYHVQLSPLGQDDCKMIVQMYLGKFNKTLDQNQLQRLTSHEGAAIPLWLSLACEELRVFGDFSTLTNKICSLPEDLKGLLSLILDRLLTEDSTQCMEKVLCLMEVSPGGIPEKQILPLLGDLEHKKPAPMMTWATLRRHLKSFIRTEAAWSLDTSRVRFFHQSVNGLMLWISKPLISF